MGLEVVEFVIDLETTLGVSIPDKEFNTIRTPRELVRYLHERVPPIGPSFGGSLRRWTEAELEQIVMERLARHSRHGGIDLDTDLRAAFA